MVSSKYTFNGQAADQVIAAGWGSLRRAVVYYWTQLQTALNVGQVSRHANAPAGCEGMCCTNSTSPRCRPAWA